MPIIWILELITIQLLYQLLVPVAGMAKRRLSSTIEEPDVIFDPCSLGIDNNALAYIKLEGTLRVQSIKLIHKCAGTLQQLHFKNYSSTSDSLTGLILNDDGYMVYLNTKSLYIALCKSDKPIHQLPRFPESCIPFPQVRKLSMVGSYPFKDIVLFRGNQLTLQSLVLGLNSQLVDILVKYRVFSATSHQNLQQVKPMDDDGMFSETPKDGFI